MDKATITATSATSDPMDTGQKFNKKHLISVDALRGIAAIYVVCMHNVMVPAPHLAVPDWVRPVILSGGTGVSMFFVVSAFTLSISWFSRKEEKHPVRNFYLRRIFRIVPLFYFLLAVTLFRDWYVWHFTHYYKEIILSVCMLFNLIPGRSTGIVWASWTIGVEMLFYLMFPLVIRLASTPTRLIIFLIASIELAILFYQGVHHSSMTDQKKAEFFPTGIAAALPVFVLGIATYTIFCSDSFKRNQQKWAGVALVAAALVYHLIFAYSGMYTGKVGASWSAPAWIFLVLGLAINPLRPIVNLVTQFYGRISYSVYLNHPIVLVILGPCYAEIYRRLPSSCFALLACFAVTFTVLTPWAFLTYKVIEQPGIRLGSRLIKSLEQS